MGDLGRLYVAEDVVPAYKKAVHHADLILPNQFETEWVLPFETDRLQLTISEYCPESKSTTPPILPTP
jgi:pyridoxal/pyridoxine/pyridoxamine kinase